MSGCTWATRLALLGAALLLPTIPARAAMSGQEREAPPAGAQVSPEAEAGRFLLEGYPSRVLRGLAAKQVRNRATSRRLNVPFALLVPVTRRWVPGQVVRVAFVAGDARLHEQIEAAALAWVDATTGGNLQLSFRNQDRTFRTWSASDENYQAEIRIAFVEDDPDNDGYWSLVGRDSIDGELVGGRPGDASMNLEGFDRALPAEWQETVLHEFGHALGFEHEHQGPLAQCGFKFEDDPGYVPTTNRDGVFIRDREGREPGLYTYLMGPPNDWERPDVDFNLRQIEITDEFFSSGEYDNLSVMRYWFPDFFFQAGTRSPCYSEGENLTLSPQDLAAARTVYPPNPSNELVVRRQIIHQLTTSAPPNSRLAETLRRAFAAEATLE